MKRDMIKLMSTFITFVTCYSMNTELMLYVITEATKPNLSNSVSTLPFYIYLEMSGNLLIISLI